MSGALRSPGNDAAEPIAALSPLDAYSAALARYDSAHLVALSHALVETHRASSPRAMAAVVADHLSEAKTAARLIATLPHGSRLALCLMALAEVPSWPIEGLSHALTCLGVKPQAAIRTLVKGGLVAAAVDTGFTLSGIEQWIDSSNGKDVLLHAHPTVLSASRTVLPEAAEDVLPRASAIILEREADGLEPVLRSAVVWQRVAGSPLRQTQQGTFYKRDRERLEDDPTVAGPIADAIEPLPDMASLWLSLARNVGLLHTEAGSDRVTAAEPRFWSDNAFHLPQMIATRWLGLWTWHEQGGVQQEGATVRLALPFVRLPVLLWLATLGEGEWVAISDLAAALQTRSPGWDRPAFQGRPDLQPGDVSAARTRSVPRGRTRGKAAEAADSGPGHSALEALLLGAAYQFNLIRTGEEVGTGRCVVQLSALGRYLLALGPPPPPRNTYPHFLFVQPSFEIIAYRQGLTPALAGQFTRFAAWSQVGAALALRLTPESVYLGLEGGLSPDEMLDLLKCHSSRPLPAGIAEALRTWSDRRDRVTYHAAATLIEFGSPEDLELTLAEWRELDLPAPVRVSDRLLLVEDERAIPFQRFRLTGARDYRRPPDECVDVEVDGVTLTLDPARSDLLVDAELGRFADEQPASSPGAPHSRPLRRRFVVSAASLARAADLGMGESALSEWFQRRAGSEVPAAMRLLLLGASGRLPSLTTARPLIVRTSTAEILDGLTQHPDTRDLLGERLGPTAVTVLDEVLPAFLAAIARLGFPVHHHTTSASPVDRNEERP